MYPEKTHLFPKDPFEKHKQRILVEVLGNKVGSPYTNTGCVLNSSSQCRQINFYTSPGYLFVLLSPIKYHTADPVNLFHSLNYVRIGAIRVIIRKKNSDKV